VIWFRKMNRIWIVPIKFHSSNKNLLLTHKESIAHLKKSLKTAALGWLLVV